MFFTTARAPVVSTLIKVPKGGVEALLIARISPSLGSKASSSARVGSPAKVVTSPTVRGGFFVRSKLRTRAGASVTKRNGKAATTPLGPAVAVEKAGGEIPANGGWPFVGKIWVTIDSALTTSTAKLLRSAR